MCNLCKGTGIVHDQGSYYSSFHGCPNCEPMPEAQWQARIKAIYDNVTARKAELERINLVKEVC